MKQDSSLEKDCHGETDVENLEIRLNPRHASTSRITLLHEIIHVSLGISGVSELLEDKQEEAICRCLEYALLDYINFQGHE